MAWYGERGGRVGRVHVRGSQSMLLDYTKPWFLCYLQDSSQSRPSTQYKVNRSTKDSNRTPSRIVLWFHRPKLSAPPIIPCTFSFRLLFLLRTYFPTAYVLFGLLFRSTFMIHPEYVPVASYHSNANQSQSQSQPQFPCCGTIEP